MFITQLRFSDHVIIHSFSEVFLTASFCQLSLQELFLSLRSLRIEKLRADILVMLFFRYNFVDNGYVGASRESTQHAQTIQNLKVIKYSYTFRGLVFEPSVAS